MVGNADLCHALGMSRFSVLKIIIEKGLTLKVGTSNGAHRVLSCSCCGALCTALFRSPPAPQEHHDTCNASDKLLLSLTSVLRH